jgi:hypothetical protein
MFRFRSDPKRWVERERAERLRENVVRISLAFATLLAILSATLLWRRFARRRSPVSAR